ncbi:MAG: PorV/PorQ family protein [Calditrichaeota bacterium]|nr:PorV/PorQ family protein [Calditrichota bacterium]
MNRKIISSRILIVLGVIFGLISAALAQNGSAGLQPNFNLGIGARALSLGNAYVAMPFDASAIYWNPAGLDHIQYQQASMFYTNLLAGTNYYFLGYVHPTLSFGSFGMGIIGYGLGDIDETDEQNVKLGVRSASEELFLLSYGRKLPWNLSIGVNLKIQHQNFLGFTATGVGADFGFLYRPDFTHPLLSGLSVGMLVQNLVGPRLKAGTATDIIPVDFRIGVAKPFLTTEWGPQLTLFFDLEQGENVPMKFHVGTEYVFQNRAMLRVGVNNNQISFGAGAVFNRFQLDYSYGKFAENEISASHRLSFSVRIGKSKDERIRIAEEKRLQEIRQRVNEELYMERQQRIAESMKEGKQYMEAADYARAIREFNFVVKYKSEMPEDLVIAEAEKLLDLAQQKSLQELAEQVRIAQAKTAEEQKREEQKLRLNQLHQQALAYFEKEEYDKAIEQWQMMLEIAPDNPIAKENIAKAKADLERKLLSLINRADQLARKGNYYAAIRVLDSARRLNPDEKKIQMIDQKVTQYDKRLNFDDLYQQGYRYYRMKDWTKAMNSFQKALAYEPNNENVKKAFFDAKARANAKKEPLTGAAKEHFLEGIRAFRAGKYEEALKIWEDLQQQQPYNKFILDSIDMAREKIEQLKRSPKQP